MHDLVTSSLPDIQQSPDRRGVAIERVGISNLRYPLSVLDREHGSQQTTATLALSVALPAEIKGTHMSRFIEVLSSYQGVLSTQSLPEFLARLRERLKAPVAQIDVSFPLFLGRAAPATGKSALMDYTCALSAEDDGTHVDIVQRVEVHVASLCPCSKEISDYGAHNQRGRIDIAVRTAREPDGTPSMIWFEELIEVAEQSASSPLYPLLKREDERHVTMAAYDNPAFVEDILRNVAVRLREDARISWFDVGVTNFESIHNHNAFARVSWVRPGA
ncbi:MAG: GTP cyclohydrolase FolE2 [Bacteroidota bacterium]